MHWKILTYWVLKFDIFFTKDLGDLIDDMNIILDGFKF